MTSNEFNNLNLKLQKKFNQKLEKLNENGIFNPEINKVRVEAMANIEFSK